MTPAEFLALGESRLASAELPDPRLEAEFLFAEITGKKRYDWLLQRTAFLDAETSESLEQGLARREAREPLAYISGRQPFLDFEVHVTTDVLIPRPETERLAELALERLTARTDFAGVIDVGTGSGCLALALARHPTHPRVWGLDLSQAALAVARGNAARWGLSNRIEWMKSDLLGSWQPLEAGPLLVVANLPYIRRGDLASLSPEVQKEPVLALDGGENGLDLITRLLDEAAAKLPYASEVWLEVGWDQAGTVTGLLQKQESWTDVGLEWDYSGIGRVVHATIRHKKDTHGYSAD